MPLLSDAIRDFYQAKRSERVSEETLKTYGYGLRAFQKSISNIDVELSEITPRVLRAFLGSQTHIAPKTLLNIHIALSSFFTFCVTSDLCAENPMKKLKRPRQEKHVIEPYTRQELQTLLEKTVPPASGDNRNPRRDHAIILVLLDSGLRASELCNMRQEDFRSNGLLRVKGKGGKERHVPLSTQTTVALNKYIEYERFEANSEQRLFTSNTGTMLDHHALLRIIRSICRNAGVKHAGVHRFRHTFAINYLRNGGNIYALQAILGHETLEMVKRYLALAQVDLLRDHLHASPVINFDFE